MTTPQPNQPKREPWEELLPCPFCGEPAERDFRRHFREITHGYLDYGAAAYCSKCHADMTVCRGDTVNLTDEERLRIVAEAWNHRTPDTATAELRRKVEEADLVRIALGAADFAEALEIAQGLRAELAAQQDRLSNNAANYLLECAELHTEIAMLKEKCATLDAQGHTQLNRAVNAEFQLAALRAENERLKSGANEPSHAAEGTPLATSKGGIESTPDANPNLKGER